MFAKDGSLVCPEWLAWVRTFACAYCLAEPQSQAHHWPPKGRSGVTRDDKTIPACAACHQAADGQRVVINGRVLPVPTDELQDRLVARQRQRFFDDAPQDVVEAYARARRTWLEKRGML